jgi:hypothetical protein
MDTPMKHSEKVWVSEDIYSTKAAAPPVAAFFTSFYIVRFYIITSMMMSHVLHSFLFHMDNRHIGGR